MAVKLYSGGDAAFDKACEKAEIKPTKRQYKKWQQKKGTAWAKRA